MWFQAARAGAQLHGGELGGGLRPRAPPAPARGAPPARPAGRLLPVLRGVRLREPGRVPAAGPPAEEGK